MAAILEIINTIKMKVGGQVWQGRHGGDTDSESEPLQLSVVDDPYTGLPAITGLVNTSRGTLATAAGATIWDEDTEYPADFILFWLKTTQTCYVQLIGQATNVSLQVYPYVPFIWQGNKLLAAANTTVLSAAPTLAEIDSIRLWNESGNTLQWERGLYY